MPIVRDCNGLAAKFIMLPQYTYKSMGLNGDDSQYTVTGASDDSVLVQF